jgi:putative transposase
MPRPPRIYIPDLALHVCQRGVDRQTIYLDDDDRERYLNTLAVIAEKYGVEVHAYTLMDNHYHLIVTPRAEAALADATRWVNWNYTMYFNRKYERTGPLWNERPRVIPIEDERQWFTCLRYVELNPLRANMVTAPDQYRWSSYRVHAHGEANGWLVPHHLFTALGATDAERQAAYRAMCGVPLTDQELAMQRHPPKRLARPESVLVLA